MRSAGEIPASERGMSRPTGNRALGSWRQRHELSVGTSDEQAVTQVKRLSLVMIVNRRPTASYWLEGNSRSPHEGDGDWRLRRGQRARHARKWKHRGT